MPHGSSSNITIPEIAVLYCSQYCILLTIGIKLNPCPADSTQGVRIVRRQFGIRDIQIFKNRIPETLRRYFTRVKGIHLSHPRQPLQHRIGSEIVFTDMVENMKKLADTLYLPNMQVSSDKHR